MLNSDLFEILKFIRSHSDGVYLDESYPDMPSSFQQIRLDFLCERGLVERFRAGSSVGLRILPAGEVQIESYLANSKSIRKATRRYWLTTAIAAIALLKSFSPELIELWAALSPLLSRLWKAISAAWGA